jgi:hypothetical protein
MHPARGFKMVRVGLRLAGFALIGKASPVS